MRAQPRPCRHAAHRIRHQRLETIVQTTMITHSKMRRRWLPSAMGIAMLTCAIGAQAATGARVLLQTWNPQTPDQQGVVTLVDQPSLVSDSLQDAWMRARSQICTQLKLKMGAGGAAAGQTLYDIDCVLDPHAALTIEPAGQNALRARFAVSGSMEATSTTPTVLGSYADPRFSLALTAREDLILAVQPDPGKTLHVSKALFTLDGATLDSHNFSGDVLKFVADDLIPFFGGPSYKQLAENAIDALSIDFANDFDAALAPVNAQLQGPSDAVRVGVSASGNYISVAFAPREFVPPTNGSMVGVFHWNPAEFTPRNGCQGFDIHATVQTGPVPMFTANAAAPTRDLGQLQSSQITANTCAFTLRGLAAGWPNALATRVEGGTPASPGSSILRVGYALVGDGWDGRVVIPQPEADSRNYRVARSLDATAIKAPDYRKLDYRIDPRVNPADAYTRQALPVDRAIVHSAAAARLAPNASVPEAQAIKPRTPQTQP
jgi:hypothetical protein